MHLNVGNNLLNEKCFTGACFIISVPLSFSFVSLQSFPSD